MAYNSAVHEGTSFTSYFLEHGRETRLPEDLVTTPVPEPGHTHRVWQEIENGTGECISNGPRVSEYCSPKTSEV